MTDLKFDDKGLIAAIAQDAYSGEVLMQAFMNAKAVELTLNTGFAHYYSRSRKKIWKKGEESGNVQKVVSASLDCDKDCMLLKVVQTGNACHTGAPSCFFNTVKENQNVTGIEMLSKLEKIIADRKANPVEGSYTNHLLSKGADKICKKIGEEAAELIIAAKNNDKKEIINEACDLIYHLLVLCADKDISLSELTGELKNRH